MKPRSLIDAFVAVLRPASLLLLALLCQQSIRAQLYRMSATSRPGGTVDTVLLDRPGLVFLSYWDIDGRSRLVAGERVWMGFTPLFFPIDAGTLDSVGVRTHRVQLPPLKILEGVTFFGQSIVIDTSAQNGAFRASTGASTVVHGEPNVIALRFDDALLEGWTGRYDRVYKERLMALAPTRRRVKTVDPRQYQRSPLAVTGPLNRHGERQQVVLRPRDVQAGGFEELLVGLRWRPHGGLRDDAFASFVVDASHSRVVPDFRVDRVAQRPLYPQSGLDLDFAKNLVKNEKPVRVWDSPYQLRRANLDKDGYTSFPAPRAAFFYNGFDSLLLDFRVAKDSKASGTNGFATFVPILTSHLPRARVYDSGTLNSPVDPDKSTKARGGDNLLYDFELEFVRVTSRARSPWIDSKSIAPKWQTPRVAADTPPGTSIAFLYRGAADASGKNATPWSPDIGFVTSRRYLQIEVRLRGTPTGELPSIDTLALPFR